MTRKHLSLFSATVFVLVVGGARPVSAQHGGDPCAGHGYPEPRLFLDAQGWWSPQPIEGGIGHLHIGGCFPSRASGLVELDLVAQLFHVDGVYREIEVKLGRVKPEIKLALTCRGHCAQTVQVLLDTAAVGRDGYELLEIDVHARLFDGIEQHARLRHWIWLDNGHPVQRTKAGPTEGIGWVTAVSGQRTHGYVGVKVFAKFLPQSDGRVELPWGVGLKFDPPRGFASLDANVHAGSFGEVLYDGPAGKRAILVDDLAPGFHRVFLQADDTGKNVTTEAVLGVLVMGVMVE